jgi:hypothetical protein
MLPLRGLCQAYRPRQGAATPRRGHTNTHTRMHTHLHRLSGRHATCDQVRNEAKGDGALVQDHRRSDGRSEAQRWRHVRDADCEPVRCGVHDERYHERRCALRCGCRAVSVGVAARARRRRRRRRPVGPRAPLRLGGALFSARSQMSVRVRGSGASPKGCAPMSSVDMLGLLPRSQARACSRNKGEHSHERGVTPSELRGSIKQHRALCQDSRTAAPVDEHLC